MDDLITHEFPLDQINEAHPVSYTHLDVYKRQKLRSTCSPSVRDNICYLRYSADTADHAGSCYRSGMRTDRKIRHTFYNGDSGRCF